MAFARVAIGRSVYVIASLYAPVGGPEEVQKYRDFRVQIRAMTERIAARDDILLFGGDWNAVVNPGLDRKVSKAFEPRDEKYALFLRELQLVECYWKERRQEVRRLWRTEFSWNVRSGNQFGSVSKEFFRNDLTRS